GNIELVYGNANRNASTGFGGGMDPLWAGFSTGSAANTFATITTATGTVTTTGAATSQQYTLGAPIAELTSASDGNRRIYTFAPPTPLAPTAINFTAVGATSMTLNWTDNEPAEVAYYVYRSDDNGTTYNLVSSLPANSISSVQNGLAPNKLYFWKVYSVSEGKLSTSLDGSQATAAPGNITSNGTGGGLWSVGASWTGGIAPGAGDSVTVLNGDVVTVDGAATALVLYVGTGVSGSVVFDAAAARTLTIGTNLSINSGASVLSAATGTILTHVLSVGGNLTNNGTLDLSTNANTAGANLTFTGAQSNTFTGIGGTNDVRTMTMVKGANTNILEMSPTNFTVQGVSTDVAGFLTLTSGTLKMSGSYILTNRLFTVAGYSIPAAAGLWINNPSLTVAGQGGSATCAGLFRMSQGVYNIGTGTGNSFGFSAGANITVEGGLITSTGRFAVAAAANIISFTMSGGTITVCTIGNASASLASFDIGTSTSSTISISGGIINIQLASTAATGPRDYRFQSGGGIASVLGGTVQFGNASSGAARLFNAAGVFPNIVVDGTSAGHTLTLLAPAVYNNVSLNITTGTGTTFNPGNNIFLFAGTTVTNNGTFTHTGASSRFITFAAGTNETWTGAGTVT
ncbi:MAG: fibronectin type III domain-containing protein, partial [Bacteroidota bacterium]